jgi:hypothetical protein
MGFSFTLSELIPFVFVVYGIWEQIDWKGPSADTNQLNASSRAYEQSGPDFDSDDDNDEIERALTMIAPHMWHN